MYSSQSKPAQKDFASLLVKHDRSLLHYIMTFVPRHDDAEEVLQRVAIVLWEKFEEYDTERDFLPWALRFAYFEVLNFRKEGARTRLVFSEDLIRILAIEREAERDVLEAQCAALQHCLGHLDADSAALLKRRYCEAKTIVDLAADLGKSVKSLYRRLDRLRDQIAVCVERRLTAEGIL